EQAHNVGRPPDRHGTDRKRVFEHEIPADEPGHELPERCVRIGVGAAGHGDHRSQLGVAERREGARTTREQERHHERRSRGVGGGGPRKDEDPGTDDRADAERGERWERESADKLLILSLGGGYRLDREQAGAHGTSTMAPLVARDSSAVCASPARAKGSLSATVARITPERIAAKASSAIASSAARSRM